MIVRIEFTESVLGTISGNREIAEEFIVTKHLKQYPRTGQEQQEELDAIPVDECLEKATTIFARDEDGNSMLWDYQVKGFLKEACLALIEAGQHTKEQLQKVSLSKYTYKRIIGHSVFVFPRRIRLQLAGDLSFVERPLQGETQRGPRICLARSESAPAGTAIEIEVRWLNAKLGEFIHDWLDYGALFGIGQWRGSGHGRFKWQDITPTVKA